MSTMNSVKRYPLCVVLFVTKSSYYRFPALKTMSFTRSITSSHICLHISISNIPAEVSTLMERFRHLTLFKRKVKNTKILTLLPSLLSICPLLNTLVWRKTRFRSSQKSLTRSTAEPASHMTMMLWLSLCFRFGILWWSRINSKPAQRTIRRKTSSSRTLMILMMP